MKTAPLSRRDNMVVQDLENEILIYDLRTNKTICLNQTSSMVWQLCNGKRSVAEISDAMSIKLKTLVSEDLVWLALEGLKKEKLLENAFELPSPLAGMTRREMAKRVGLVSLVVLPMVSSVVAPTAATAQSVQLMGLGIPCSSPTQCQSGNCTTVTMICCAPGVNSASDFSTVCSTPGTCGALDFCCSGMFVDQGPANCGGAGTACVCPMSLT